MSIEREATLTRFTCDGPACHKNYEGEDGFTRTWQEARTYGWVNTEYAGVWTHYCPSCKKQLGD